MAGEILPVIGTIGLLGLWLYQQKQIEKFTNELRKINSARNVYQTYQSNNAIFNAMKELAPLKKNATDTIFSYQIYNYELGLADIEKVLSKTERRGLPHGKTDQSDIMGNPQKAFELTQKRLEILYDKLDQKEKTIQLASEKSKKRYFWAYIFLSTISIIGAVFKILGKTE
jgi:hypothetical protein